MLFFRVHTYSSIDGTEKRIQQVIQAMQILGGMRQNSDGLVYFPCGNKHEGSMQTRLFWKHAKIAPDSLVEIRPLNTLDKKSKLTITVDSVENGTYSVRSKWRRTQC